MAGVDLAIGTAIGSNIVNILLILGLAALLHPFRVHSDVLRRELPLMLVVSLLAGYVLYDGVLSVGDGIFLLALGRDLVALQREDRTSGGKTG